MKSSSSQFCSNLSSRKFKKIQENTGNNSKTWSFKNVATEALEFDTIINGFITCISTISTPRYPGYQYSRDDENNLITKPIMYGDLTDHLCKWIELIAVNKKRKLKYTPPLKQN